MYHVLLFYKWTAIQHPKAEVTRHKEICNALQLTGRIIMNEDGINGTVGGSKASIDLYRDYMDKHRRFKHIDWKESTSEIPPFPKMSVKYRKEIITTETPDEIELCQRGKHVDRETFHQWLVNGEDMVILDMRNDYEWEIGRFVNAVRPPMKYFRELKDNMDFYEQFKGKKIVMFCTGGIRCEPASAYFIEKGFDRDNIYQLEGGIVKYAEKYANEGYYEGKCFVFDDRLAVPVDTSENAKIIGSCYVCSCTCDTYRNCANKFCNRLYIGCENCVEKLDNTCCEDCQHVIADPTNMRPARGQFKEVPHRNK